MLYVFMHAPIHASRYMHYDKAVWWREACAHSCLHSIPGVDMFLAVLCSAWYAAPEIFNGEGDSKLGTHNTCKMGLHDISKMGMNNDSKLGMNTDSKLGMNTDSKLGMNTDSKLGTNTDSKLRMNNDSKPGMNNDSKLGTHAASMHTQS